MTDQHYCGFCGKSQDDVALLIAGPSVFICDECTEMCMGILLQNREKTRGERKWTPSLLSAAQAKFEINHRIDDLIANLQGLKNK